MVNHFFAMTLWCVLKLSLQTTLKPSPMTDKSLQRFQNCITLDTTSNVVLNANQYGALVSWAFNVGCGATGSSTLIARLNNGEAPNTVAAEELPKWNKGGGQVLPGLTRRRAEEVELHRTATSVGALPACS